MKNKCYFIMGLCVYIFFIMSCFTVDVNFEELEKKVFHLKRIFFITDNEELLTEENSDKVFSNIPLEEINKLIYEDTTLKIDYTEFIKDKENGFKYKSWLTNRKGSTKVTGYWWNILEENEEEYVAISIYENKNDETTLFRVFLNFKYRDGTVQSVRNLYLSKEWLNNVSM